MYGDRFRGRCQVSEFMVQANKMNSTVFICFGRWISEHTMGNPCPTSCVCLRFVPNSTREPSHSRDGCKVWKIFFFPCKQYIFTLALLWALVGIPITEHTLNAENGMCKLNGHNHSSSVWQQASKEKKTVRSVYVRHSWMCINLIYLPWIK